MVALGGMYLYMNFMLKCTHTSLPCNPESSKTNHPSEKTIDQCLNLCLLNIKSLSWTNPWAAMANAAGRVAGNAAANGGSMGK